MPDFRNYPRAVIEECEAKLRREGVPDWFMSGFGIVEGSEHDDWGRAEVIAWEYPKPIVEIDGYRWGVDVSDCLTTSQWEMLKLAAVARAWLDNFGKRTPWELTLACQFSRLDGWLSHQRAMASRAGRQAVSRRKGVLSERDRQIKLDALTLIGEGVKPRNIATRLAEDEAFKNARTGEPLTRRQISTILRKVGVLREK